MPAPAEPFEFDNMQRPIVAPPLEQLQEADRVTVSVDDEGHKVYVVERRVAS